MATAKKAPIKRAAKKRANPKTKALFSVFERSGFKHIYSDNIHITFHGLTSEIDHIFAIDNVLVLCEKTTSAKITEHFPKKKDFHEKITEHKPEFIDQYQEINEQFKEYISQLDYSSSDYEVRSIYYSENAGFSEGIVSNPGPFILMSPEINKYFRQLAGIIHRSARYEIFKYLQVGLAQIGENRLRGRRPSSSNFDAFVLPGRHTNYPDDFILVSFYIDPETLIKQAYVLRRDGWANADHSYQRFIQKNKIKKMRDYLSEEGKVFVNNLIITLPNTVTVKDIENETPLRANQIDDLQHVELSIPEEHCSIGIIDGQHRIFAYHEGDDICDEKISGMRQRQNLLATAIIFPSHYTAEKRVKFEADLFLKINNTQTNVTDALKQELETIINPTSALSIAKQVASRLASGGPLSDHVQTSIYDGSDKIKTASAVRYALQPLVNPKAANSLFSAWPNSKAVDITEVSTISDYADFCQKTLNLAFVGLKRNLNGRWAQKTRKNTQLVLSPTLIGAVFFYVRSAIENSVDLGAIDYLATFQGVEDFSFTDYSSSKWSQLGTALYTTYPPKLMDPSPVAC